MSNVPSLHCRVSDNLMLNSITSDPHHGPDRDLEWKKLCAALLIASPYANLR